jgi:aspartate racemase
MKTIGLIGGLSWESTQDYYRHLNEETKKRLGQNHSARIIMYSVDFQDVEECVSNGKMPELTQMMKNIAMTIEKAGAECLMIGANTMHMLAPAITAAIQIPLIHIAEATAKKVLEQGFHKVGLLGTKPTMEMNFYKEILKQHGIETLIPDASQRDFIQKTIFTELFSGVLNDASRKEMLNIIDQLVAHGAEGVILGCTEIPLLVKQEHTKVALFDTTYIHACAGVDFAIG